jgi:hypothetical protein
MPQSNSSSNVQNERTSLRSLGKLRRTASFKSMVKRANDERRKATDRPDAGKQQSKHEIEPARL